MDLDLLSFPCLPRPPVEGRTVALAEATAGKPMKMHDGMALHSWIDNVQRQRSAHTARSYLKEAWRYRMWLEYRYGREARLFYKVRADDINAYLDFLDSPVPFPLPLLASYNRTTQPFNGPLSPSSKAQAITILGAMYEFFRKNPDLDNEPICRFNPFDAVRGIAARSRIKTGEGVSLKTQKIVPLDAWHLVTDYLDRQVANEPKNPEAHRNRWVMHLLYEAWVRREEAARLKMGHFQPSPDGSGWEVLVLGKGNKLRSVLVTDGLLDALRAYRQSLGLPALPAPGENRPAVMPFRVASTGDGNVSPQTIYRICTSVLEAVATEVEAVKQPGQGRVAEVLRAATTHWMRHSGASHTADAGLDPKLAMQQLGHEDIRITMSTYYHPDRSLMRAQLEAAATARKKKAV
jgi:integrase/recombinase XerD